ncbi:MAG: hypothetical protein ACJ76Z_15515 [Thermoleophilaceae bacterium]
MRFLLALGVALLALAAPAAQAGTPGTVTNYPLPTGSNPQGIVSGPDGGLWITLRGPNRIARMTPAGALTTFDVPTANAGVDRIVTGPDGNLWFTETSASRIGRITTAGAITEFPTPTAGAQPHAIVQGPDGNLWFTETGSPGRIGRITTAGAVTEFATPGNVANDLTQGPDGNIWYTASSTNLVGRMDPAGNASEFFAPGTPTGIITADASSLWYTPGSGGAMGRITTAGVRTSSAPLPTNTSVGNITSGPEGNGNAWFTENIVGRVGFITPSAQVTEFAVGPTLGALTAGPDGAIWVLAPNADRVARVDTSVSGPAIPPPELGKSMGASLVSGRVLVKLPGSARFVALAATQSLPLGTVVDARSGVLQLTATSGGAPYSANFYKGQFQTAQRKKNGATADLKLVGGRFKGCPPAARAAANKTVRKLWGKGSGRFRTVGRFSAASVRGTTWLTADQCSGTLTRVTAGSVTVRDFVRRKAVVVKAGHSYFAAARR